MRTHPLLAFVTTISTCSILGASHLAEAQTHTPSASVVRASTPGRLAALRSTVTGHAAIRPRVRRPYVALGGVWLSLRRCESHDNYTENSGNGYYGAYQFSTSTWHTIGEVGLPSAAPPQVQDAAARSLFHRQGWRAWPNCSWRAGLV
jgi:hypothetical protein